MHARLSANKRTLLALAAVILGATSTVLAVQPPIERGRFGALVIGDPAMAQDVATISAQSLAAAERVGSEGFRAAHGESWAISLDRRSDAPLLVEGKGIPFPVGAGATASGQCGLSTRNNSGTCP